MDFVLLQFPSLRKNIRFDEIRDVLAHEIVKKSETELLHRLRQTRSEDKEDTFGLDSNNKSGDGGSKLWKFMTPVDIHCAFAALKMRLTFLTNLLTFEPNLLKHCQSPELTEFNLDVVLLEKLLEDFIPGAAKFIKSPEFTKEWSAKVNKITAMFHNLKNCLPHQEEEEERIRNLELTMTRCNVLKLLLSHITKNQFFQFLPVKPLQSFSRALKNNSLKTKSEMDAFLEQLCELNNASVKHHFAKGNKETCPLCAADLVVEGKEPVELVCGHIGCKTCLEPHFREKGDGKSILYRTIYSISEKSGL